MENNCYTTDLVQASRREWWINKGNSGIPLFETHKLTEEKKKIWAINQNRGNHIKPGFIAS